MKLSEVDINQIKQKGRLAFLNGFELKECGYRPYSLGEKLWIEGWREEYLKCINESLDDDEILSSDQFYLRYGWWPFYEKDKQIIEEAIYKGKKVPLRKPLRGDVKKFKVYVNSGRKDKDGNIIAKKVEFGDVKGGLRIRKNNPEARKNFAARHNCKEKLRKGDETTAGYWSCRGITSKVGGIW